MSHAASGKDNADFKYEYNENVIEDWVTFKK